MTGFEAGYMSAEEAVCCILKAIHLFRNGDNGHFGPEHPEYERTVLKGWSAGAIGLRTVTIRLGISGKEAVERMRMWGIELPYTADREVRHVESLPVRRLTRAEVGYCLAMNILDRCGQISCRCLA